MRTRPTLLLVACTVVAAALATPAQAATAAAAATALEDCTAATHCYQMDEAAKAADAQSVMTDSGATPVDGTVGAFVNPGKIDGGTTYYQFPQVSPNTTPADRNHLVTIPDSPSVRPGDLDYTITIRYRTTHNFGNLIQKGQSATKGGQFKIQLPKGRPSCYFKGSVGRVGIGWTTSIADGQWHTLVCSRTSDRVTLSVDGAAPRVKRGVSGALDNTSPVSIGGKYTCDQVKITCDYFWGDVDYVSLQQG
jgi:hypothetical protein